MEARKYRAVTMARNLVKLWEKNKEKLNYQTVLK